LLLLAAASLLCACRREEAPAPSAKSPPAPLPTTQRFKFGLATGLGGLGDRSFNDMQYNGMILAKQQYGIEFEYACPTSIADFEPVIEGLIRQGCNVVLAGGGIEMTGPLDRLSVRHPGVTFILLDDRPRQFRPNVASVRFRQNESAFLAGALAALMSRTNRIAAIGGEDIPVIRDFLAGYSAGARHVKPGIRIVEEFVRTADPRAVPWSNPETAKRIAHRLYAAGGVDVIFGVASASNLGIFRAAEESGRFAIGVDSDQDYQVPGTILTSAVKRLDLGITFLVGKVLDGSLENREYILGLKEAGVGLTPMDYTRDKIPSAVLARVEALKQAIMANEIVVPSVFSAP